jgi:hypothetical protein
MALDVRESAADGAGGIESIEHCAVSASRRHWPHGQNTQTNQPHALDGGRGFYLAICGSYLPDGRSSEEVLAVRTTNSRERAEVSDFETATIFRPICSPPIVGASVAT